MNLSPFPPNKLHAAPTAHFGQREAAFNTPPEDIRHREPTLPQPPPRSLWRLVWDTTLRWVRQMLGLSEHTRGQLRAQTRQLTQELALTRRALSETNMLLDSIPDACFEQRMAGPALQAARLDRLRETLTTLPMPPVPTLPAQDPGKRLRLLSPTPGDPVNETPSAGDAAQTMAPTFENAAFGFRLLPPGQAGSLSIQGEKAPYQSPFLKKPRTDNALERLDFWTKTPASLLDAPAPGTPFSESVLANLVQHEAILGSLSDQQVVDCIQALKPLWNTRQVCADLARNAENTQWADLGADRSAGRVLLQGLLTLAASRKLGMPFEAGLLADTGFNGAEDPAAIRQALTEEGFTFCPEGFQALGMTTTRDFWRERLARQAVEPSPGEARQLRLLRALALFYADKGRAPDPTLRQTIEKTPLGLYTPRRPLDPSSALSLTQDAVPTIWLSRALLQQEDFDTAASQYLLRLAQTSQDPATPSARPFPDEAMQAWLARIQATFSQNPAHWANKQHLDDLRRLWQEAIEPSRQP